MLASSRVDERLERVVKICRDAGVRVTPQRVEILRCIAGSEMHPDAETVYKCVRKIIPAISLDTVYRTLRLFEAKCVIARINAGRDRVRFDANMARHHHFVCTRCGLVRDFYDEQFNGLKAPRVVEEMGAVESAYVELRGLCRNCRV